jgi:hypothetical protein
MLIKQIIKDEISYYENLIEINKNLGIDKVNIYTFNGAKRALEVLLEKLGNKHGNNETTTKQVYLTAFRDGFDEGFDKANNPENKANINDLEKSYCDSFIKS